MSTKPVITRIAVLILALWVSTLSAAEQQARSTKWAQPIKTGQLQNFYKLGRLRMRPARCRLSRVRSFEAWSVVTGMPGPQRDVG